MLITFTQVIALICAYDAYKHSWFLTNVGISTRSRIFNIQVLDLKYNFKIKNEKNDEHEEDDHDSLCDYILKLTFHWFVGVVIYYTITSCLKL